MRRVLITLVCFLSLPVMAQAQNNLAEEIAHLQSRREELKDFTQAMVARKLVADVIQAMEVNGFHAEQIKEVLQSRELKKYVTSIMNDPSLDRRLDQAFDRLLDLRSYQEQREKLQREQNTARILALKDALRRKVEEKRRYQEVASLSHEEDPWSQLWRRVKRYLLE